MMIFQKFNNEIQKIKASSKELININQELREEGLKVDKKIAVIGIVFMLSFFFMMIAISATILGTFINFQYLVFFLSIFLSCGSMFIFTNSNIFDYLFKKAFGFIENKILETRELPKYNIFTAYFVKKHDRVLLKKAEKLQEFNFLENKEFIEEVELFIKNNQPNLDSDNLEKYLESYKLFKKYIKNEDKSYAVINLGILLEIIEKNVAVENLSTEKEMSLNANI